MNATDFCYWLQGFFELASQSGSREPITLSRKQVEVIRRHLNLVFIHDIDHKAGPPEYLSTLQEVHDGNLPLSSVEEEVPINHGNSKPITFRC